MGKLALAALVRKLRPDARDNRITAGLGLRGSAGMQIVEDLILPVRIGPLQVLGNPHPHPVRSTVLVDVLEDFFHGLNTSCVTGRVTTT